MMGIVCVVGPSLGSCPAVAPCIWGSLLGVDPVHQWARGGWRVESWYSSHFLYRALVFCLGEPVVGWPVWLRGWYPRQGR